MPRGRKPNLKKEPSRQLANQRAFRKRRADLLATLQARKNELERENAILRGYNHQGTPISSLNETPAATSHSTPTPRLCQKCFDRGEEKESDEIIQMTDRVLSAHFMLLHSTESLKRLLGEDRIARLQDRSSSIAGTILTDSRLQSNDSTSVDESSFQSFAVDIPRARSLNDVFDSSMIATTSSLSAQQIQHHHQHLSNGECCLGLPDCAKEHCPFLIAGFN